MGLIARAALCLGLGAGGWEQGYATRYDKGLFERVAAARGMPVVACMVADDQAGLGEWIWVRGARTGVARRCQVTDVSAGSAGTPGSDKWRHLREGLIELDFDSAIDICGKWWRERWRNCPVWILR